MKLVQDIILLLLSIILVQSHPIKELVNKTPDNSTDADYFSISSIIERANKNAGKSKGEFTLIEGDIVVYTGLQNADQCTSYQCKWHKSSSGEVHVPYVISEQYSSFDRAVIQQGLDSFQESTCIQFIPHTTEEDYIHILSEEGCYSSVGRKGGKQVVSLAHHGCIFHKVIQHELLHVLGFHHEQNRSDRDDHVRILFENIQDGKEHNFDKLDTNNLNTPYDYNSIMQYGRTSFSKNGEPTIIPIPDSNVPIGHATEMNYNDILRVNSLYCD